MVSTARARVKQSAGNLPADVTSFVGRRREVTFTKRLLAESPVVTLTGPGGVGKTRLALRVASNMRRSFRDKTDGPVEAVGGGHERADEVRGGLVGGERGRGQAQAPGDGLSDALQAFEV